MTSATARRLSIAGILLVLVMIGVGGALGGCSTLRDWQHVDQ